MSHMAHKNAPCGIKNRAIWHLPFSYKYWYNFLIDMAMLIREG